MGFWSSFFGYAAFNAYRDIKKDKKEAQKWNDLFYEISEYETSLNNYLESIGIKATYTFDVEYVNNGNVLPEKRKMDSYRKKADEYIALGGDGRILYDLEEIDKFIEKIKYLKNIGQLERQYEFRDDDKYTVQNKIEAEKAEILHQQECIRNEKESVSEQSKVLFDLQDFLGYYYEQYDNLKTKLHQDPGDIRNRCLIIEVLHTALRMRLGLFDLDDNINYQLNTNDIQGIINILRGYLQPLVINDNSRSPSKKLQYIYYMALLLDGECSILKGDFVNAVEKYSKVLKEWKDLADNEVFMVDLVYSLFAIFRLFDLSEMIDRYYNSYVTQINNMIKLHNWNLDRDYNQKQLEKLQNKYNVTEYVTLSLCDTSNDEESILYDKGIDEWGDININFGCSKMDVNAEKNYLYFHSKNTLKKEEKETILVENISNVIERQRNIIKRSI